MKHIKISILLLIAYLFVQPNILAQNSSQFGQLPYLYKNLNVLVHVTVDSANRKPIVSDSIILETFEKVSGFFEPIGVSFTVCEIRVIENNYTYSVIKKNPISVERVFDKMDKLFTLPRRINVYLCQFIDSYDCGHAIFEGIGSESDANIWVAKDNCMDPLAENIAHQMGHIFGLHDTNQNGEELELVDGSNCETHGDLICDTPADPFGHIEDFEFVSSDPNLNPYYIDCEFILKEKDPNGDFYQPDMGNIMSPYPCKCTFTKQQYEKMVEIYYDSEFSQF